METDRVSTIAFDLAGWPGHRAGQHLDVRLTAEDGYQAQRSYSIASAPEERRLAITVERLDDGEVSPFLVGEVVVGDRLELRGPIGGYFVWDAALEPARPVLLVAGGSGIVPLMAMLRHRRASSARTPFRLLYSSRSLDDVIYRAELQALAESSHGPTVAHTLTRARPAGWPGYSRRIDAAMIRQVAWPTSEAPAAFVCGPTSFVEAAAQGLIEVGYEDRWIKTERFGATGG